MKYYVVHSLQVDFQPSSVDKGGDGISCSVNVVEWKCRHAAVHSRWSGADLWRYRAC